MPLEIAFRGHIVMCGKEAGVVSAKGGLQLGERPDVELSLLAFGISIERGAKRSFGRDHLAANPADRFLGACAEQSASGALMGKRE